MTTNNGAYMDYPDYVPKAAFFRSSPRNTKVGTVKSGQVIKALSFVESDDDGKLVAYSGFVENAEVTFAAITASQTLILGGLTYTDGGAGTTAEQLATAWAGLIDGSDGGADPATGIWSGALTNYRTEAIDDTRVLFVSTLPGTNPTDLADTGTATNPTITLIQGEATTSKIAGVLCYDVDGTSGDVDASVYTEASFWADALVWAVDTAVDTITLPTGTTVAVTAYNTGCGGTTAVSNLLKQKFVEGSEFDPMGFSKTGEVY